MSQLDFIFEAAPGAARRNDPDTSKAAAEAVAPRSGTQRRRVLDALVRFHRQGMTDAELATFLAMHPGSAAKRRGELADVGLVEDCGERRLTPHGCNAIVWKPTAEGHAAVGE